jgi:DNA repair exonuclease SbcCD ATPase subunit
VTAQPSPDQADLYAAAEDAYRSQPGPANLAQDRIRAVVDRVAELTLTRALAAEDRLALAEVHIEEMRSERDAARAEVQRLTALLELREADVDTLADANRQLVAGLAEVVGQLAALHEDIAKMRAGSGPGATETGRETAGVPESGSGGQRGAEGVSGGAA